MSPNKLFASIAIFICSTLLSNAMEPKPYHHLRDGGYRNPEGSPERSKDTKWSYRVFNKEKKKLKIKIPPNHVVAHERVLNDIRKYRDQNFVLWIGHATFLIKVGNTTIITDPVFSKNAGPLMFGPKRYVAPAIKLDELPPTDLILLTHNHYDHLDTKTIKKFPFKNAKVLVPLGLSKYFKKYKMNNVIEMDWMERIEINSELKITFLPAVHWSKRSLTDTNKTLWGSFLLQYKDKKIYFSCDTGFGNIYSELGKKYGPIDLTFINIGAYNFKPMFEKSVYHTTPEEALQVAKELGSKKVVGMHWGTFVLSLEPIMEPRKRFKNNAENYGFSTKDTIIFKIGEVMPLNQLF